MKDATGESVIGASVIVKGTTNGTITDIDGNFSLSNVKKGDVIEISFVGYITQIIKWDGTPINIILKEDTQTLEEVVVTGYGGSQKRAALTTAISKMDDQVLKNAAMSNAGQALQGSVTGLRVINTTGQPGAEPDITLRGGATITGGNSKALIVVDGIIRESMSDINPSDIESIQVLKDAASTAIYGARANGGVILVETKSGKAGKASVNYKFKLGVNFARYGYDFCNAHDYLYYNRLGYKRYTNNVPGAASVDTQTGYGTQNDLIDVKYLTDENFHLRNEGWLVMDDPYYEGKQLLYKDYSGQLDDAVFANTALTQDHYVNITGGNDKGTYMASMGYYNEDGQIKGTGYKRFNGSVSGTYKIFPFLNVKAGATYTWSQQPSLWIGSYELFYRTRSQRPTWNPYNEDGSPASGWGTGDGNPEYYRDKLTSEDGTRKSTYNFGFDLDIIPKKLTFSGNSSLYHYDYQYETFNKSYQLQTSPTPTNTRDASAKIERYTQIQVNGTLNYKDTFKDKHNLDVMVGSEYFGYNEFMMEAKTQNSPTDDIPTLNAGASRTSTKSEKTGYRIASVFGRVNYNYQMKYLLSLVARYDGISRLKDNRWGFFPGVSVGWRVSEEKFWKENVSWMDYLKVRASWGQMGNDKVDAFQYLTAYTFDNPAILGGGIESGLWLLRTANPNITWEVANTYNVGIETRFLKYFNFEADFFKTKRNNILATRNAAIPEYAGLTLPDENIGICSNIGTELTLGFSKQLNKDWSIMASGNFTYNHSTIDFIDEPEGTLDWQKRTGLSIGTDGDMYLMYEADGIFRTQEELDSYPHLAEARVGDVRFKDVYEDGVIDAKDKVRQDKPAIPRIMYGINLGANYRNWSLNMLFQGAAQVWQYTFMEAGTIGNFTKDFYENRWTENNINAEYPRTYNRDATVTGGGNYRNTFWLNNASYLRLKSIELAYDFPKSWLKNTPISAVRLSLSGYNLFTITGIRNIDPETQENSQGWAAWNTPQSKVYNFGINVTF